MSGQSKYLADLLLPGIRKAVLELSLPLATRNLRIDITRLGDTAGTIGAAFARVSDCCPLPLGWHDMQP
jgi:hypothetical protein